ncbi:MAG: hypothetical protein PHW63_09675 [Alphaproteobacteria bacterium]|nr:hypothetical protein [Alphaproteobacteria bacterium]
MKDIKKMNDAELETLRVVVLTEIEDRQQLIAIPDQLEALLSNYEDRGGDLTQIIAKVNKRGKK